MAQSKTENTRDVTASSISDLYNALQDPSSRLFIDIRPAAEYRSLHVRHAINLPPTRTDDYLTKLFTDSFFAEVVYVFGSKSQIEAKQTSGFGHRLHHVLKVKLAQTGFRVLWLDECIKAFCGSFPFLCVKDEGAIGNTMDDILGNFYKQMHTFDSYPEMIVTDKLYLGNFEHAQSKQVLEHLQITHLVNVTSRDYKDKSVLVGRDMHQILIGDHENADIAQHFEDAYTFIHNALHCEESDSKDEESAPKNTYRVLVHCKEGRSRGPTIVVSYLMKMYCMSMEQALTLVQQKRAIVDPNRGFRKQLKEYDVHDYQVKPKQM